MASLEDKILGEKLEYYCSSDEEEAVSDEEFADAESGSNTDALIPPVTYHPSENSCNTGPKGVIKDWQRFKQLEAEKRQENEKERFELAKKLSITCQSACDEEAEDPDFAELLSDQILQEFAKKKMQEMLVKSALGKRFGSVIHLKTGEEYLRAIDLEKKAVIIVLHVYEDVNTCCRTMNACLDELSQTYPSIKFCKMLASAAGLSQKFKAEGVPALLVYKEGVLIGNFIQLEKEFGVEFTANDVENFLAENGIIISNDLLAT